MNDASIVCSVGTEVMGTELMRICVKEDSDDLPSVPPGFESYATFTLKRVVPATTSDKAKTPAIESVSATEQAKMEVESDEAKAARALRRRPWINHSGCDDDGDCAANNDNAASQNPDQVRSLFCFLFLATCVSTFHLFVCLAYAWLLQNCDVKPALPKGVVRGCEECKDCQKVNLS